MLTPTPLDVPGVRKDAINKKLGGATGTTLFLSGMMHVEETHIVHAIPTSCMCML